MFNKISQEIAYLLPLPVLSIDKHNALCIQQEVFIAAVWPENSCKLHSLLYFLTKGNRPLIPILNIHETF